MNPMITQVFTTRGQKLSIADAYAQLIALNPTSIYAKEKAAGALGGASKSHFLELKNGFWTRMR